MNKAIRCLTVSQVTEFVYCAIVCAVASTDGTCGSDAVCKQ